MPIFFHKQAKQRVHMNIAVTCTICSNFSLKIRSNILPFSSMKNISCVKYGNIGLEIFAVEVLVLDKNGFVVKIERA